MNDVYVTYNGRTYVANIETGEVEVRVRIRNHDKGNKCSKWVKTTGVHVRQIVLSMAQSKATVG
jgi:hypothetical protein